MSTRAELIKIVFENTSTLKRGMQAYLQVASRDLSISRTQLELLDIIQNLQPVSFKKLAQQLYLTPGAVSQLADSLLQQGLLDRETDPNDRRIQCLRLTKKGQKVLATIDKRRAAVMKKVMQGLSTEQIQLWAHIQQNMISRFQAETAKQKEGGRTT